MSETVVDEQGRRWVRWTEEGPPIRPWLHAPEPGTSSLLLFEFTPTREAEVPR